MIGRIILIAAAVTLLVAMLGKLRLPRPPERKAVERARKCPGCGAGVAAKGAASIKGASRAMRACGQPSVRPCASRAVIDRFSAACASPAMTWSCARAQSP